MTLCISPPSVGPKVISNGPSNWLSVRQLTVNTVKSVSGTSITFNQYKPEIHIEQLFVMPSVYNMIHMNGILSKYCYPVQEQLVPAYPYSILATIQSCPSNTCFVRLILQNPFCQFCRTNGILSRNVLDCIRLTVDFQITIQLCPIQCTLL